MISALAIAFALAADSLARYEFVQAHMGTLFRIVLYSPGAGRAQMAADSAFARVAGLDSIFNDYDSTSESRRLVRQAHNAPVVVSRELFDLMAYANHVAVITGGAFDVTMGPVTHLWRRSRRSRRVPSEEERRGALAAVGHGHVALDSAKRTVTLRVPNMLLDFGGIAKGAAADAALAALRELGVNRAIVAAGGDLAVGDPPPGATGWLILGAEPDRLFSNCGISTSGDSEQFVEIRGVRYSHIIDPRTGLGVSARRQVTVVARTATKSDAFATAAYVLGEDRFREILGRGPGVELLVGR